MITEKTIQEQGREYSNRFGTFETLNTFNSVLESTLATRLDGTPVKLPEALTELVEQVKTLHAKGKKVVYVGNGGSAAISSHLATDFWKNGGVRAMAFNDVSLLTCAANDFGYEYVFSKPISMFCDPGDLVFATSSSGNSANILNAVEAAKEKGCQVASFCGFKPENKLRSRGDLNFYVNSMSYGVVEVAHLLLMHSVIDEYIRTSPMPA